MPIIPSRSHSGLLRRILITCVLVAGFLPHAHGQISTLKKAIESTQAEKPDNPVEKPEDTRKRLDQSLKEARESLARMDAPGAAATVPNGITPAELDARHNDLEQTVLAINRALKNLSSMADAAKELEASRARDTGWTGFKEQPPYPLLLLDELLDERSNTKAKLTSFEASLSNYERLLASILAEAKAAEDNVNALIAAVRNADDVTRDAAKWRMESARGKSRLLAVRAGLIQSSSASLKDHIAAVTADLALIDRKVKILSENSRLNDQDLANIGKNCEDRKKALQKETEGTAKRLKAAVAARAQAQAALDDLLSSATDNTPLPGLELAKYRVDVAEGRVDAMQSLIEGLEGLGQLETLYLKSYQERRAYIDAPNPDQKAKSLKSLEVLLERIRAWENVVDNEFASSNADLSNIESRAASINPDDPRFALLNDQRASNSEKLAMLQRVSKAVASQRKLLKRWVAEYSPDPEKEGFLEKAAKIRDTSWQIVKKIWSFELTSYEDKVEVDGQALIVRIPVTLGMLARAVLFFIIGYWIASRIANRVQATLVSRGHIADAQARTLRNWLMIFVGVFLAIGTLAFLKIPLTVFAFFGGALAIGLGFGMQTLIKNFISGMIVLAERKVRVGDILDVDGIVGTVIEINTRSSIIRGPDDVETMIPNSVFLENRVTNWTLSSKKMRRSLRVGVAYGTPPQKVMEILTAAAARHGLILKEPAPFAVLEDFGESSLVFNLYFWVELAQSTNAMIVTSDLRLMIEKRFAELEIQVPFPQRDINITSAKPLEILWSKNPADED